MTDQELIDQLEKNIALGKKTIELSLALERLQANKDFKLVIAEGYLEKEAIRLVHLKAVQSEDSTAIIRQLDAIGALQQYFVAITLAADIAVKALDQDEETVSDIYNFGGTE